MIKKLLAPYCINFEQSAGVIVFRLIDGKVEFLLLKYKSGHWQFPRGHVESGEEFIETAKRELKEETGIIKIKIKKGFCQGLSFWYKARGEEMRRRKMNNDCIFVRKKVILFLAQYLANDDIVLSDEHVDYKWLDFDKAMDLLTFDNAKTVLNKANIFIKYG